MQTGGSNSGNNNSNGKPAIINNALCLMISGRPLQTKCYQISKDKFMFEMTKPGLVKEFGISIMDLTNFPKNNGFTIHYSLSPFKEWEYLGNITYENPSKIFTAPWLYYKAITQCESCRFGLQLTTIDFINSLNVKTDDNNGVKDKKMEVIQNEFALKVAQNLFDFMNSYAKSSPQGDVLLIPAKCLDLWHEKFKNKYIKDPNFMKI